MPSSQLAEIDKEENQLTHGDHSNPRRFCGARKEPDGKTQKKTTAQ